jgi:hypothetical protein
VCRTYCAWLAGGRPFTSGMKLRLPSAEAVDVGGAEGSVIIKYCESNSSGRLCATCFNSMT